MHIHKAYVHVYHNTKEFLNLIGKDSGIYMATVFSLIETSVQLQTDYLIACKCSYWK